MLEQQKTFKEGVEPKSSDIPNIPNILGFMLLLDSLQVPCVSGDSFTHFYTVLS